MNSVMTAGLHHRWRERAADLARLRPGDRALDVATGTGDLAIELARRVGPEGEVVGADFSDGMLARARAKEPAIRWEHADALALPYDDGEFDAATVGFGARNFGDLERGLAEMARVVRSGGRVVVLEITSPSRPPLSTFFRVWFDRVVPLIGRVAADPEAYEYLPSSVKRFPGPERLAALLATGPGTAVRVAVTFVVFCGTLVVFRNATLAAGAAMLRALLVPRAGLGLPAPASVLAAALVVVAAGHAVGRWGRWPRLAARMPAPLAGFGNAAAVTLILLLAPAGGRAFVYFQF
jgi:demethylmenaquinone methyltransferase/2-methoxy-6-polyprenyl-1,4-benzoquinol methylase